VTASPSARFGLLHLKFACHLDIVAAVTDVECQCRLAFLFGRKDGGGRPTPSGPLTFTTWPTPMVLATLDSNDRLLLGMRGAMMASLPSPSVTAW
jgi:hypothetical protein